MSISSISSFFYVPLTMLFVAVLSVAIGVGGCCCTISSKGRLPHRSFFLAVFKTNLPFLLPWLRCRNISRDATFYMHRSVLGGHLLNRVRWILILEKNILWLCFMPPVVIYKVVYADNHSAFSVYWLLCLDVLRYNLENE